MSKPTTKMQDMSGDSGNQNANPNVEFIDRMIPHHQAAIDMVAEYEGKVTNPQLQGILQNIKTSQAAEITNMQSIRAEEEGKSLPQGHAKKAVGATVKLGNITVPANLQGKDLLKFLVENKSLLIAEKKSAIKHADAIAVGVDLSKHYFIDKEGKLTKSTADVTKAPDGQEVALVVINTTNWFDSHEDVHIPGIWNKSLKDNDIMLHLQEHDMSFVAVISDESKGYTQKMTWKELGINMPGVTEALLFATPFKGRNPFMEEQYRKGFVKNHSVGMRYVVIKLCVNEPDDEYFKEEYANWVQYAPMVANLPDAEARGYFWAVLEAKIIEGSAVVKGSNIITPTLSVKSAEPSDDTQQKQPADATVDKGEETPKKVNWDKIASLLTT